MMYTFAVNEFFFRNFRMIRVILRYAYHKHYLFCLNFRPIELNLVDFDGWYYDTWFINRMILLIPFLSVISPHSMRSENRIFALTKVHSTRMLFLRFLRAFIVLRVLSANTNTLEKLILFIFPISQVLFVNNFVHIYWMPLCQWEHLSSKRSGMSIFCLTQQRYEMKYEIWGHDTKKTSDPQSAWNRKEERSEAHSIFRKYKCLEEKWMGEKFPNNLFSSLRPSLNSLKTYHTLLTEKTSCLMLIKWNALYESLYLFDVFL